MGVMICNRGDCENVMCGIYSQKYGYICDECYEELLKVNYTMSISEFMKTNKNSDTLIDWDWKNKIEQEFRYDC